MLRRYFTKKQGAAFKIPDLKTGHGIQRFYKMARVEKHVQGSSGSQNYYKILLDHRPIHISGQILLLPNKPLALLLATEWQQQEKFINSNTMPIMKLISRYVATEDRDIFTDRIISFLESDSICYRDNQYNRIKNKQAEHWDPILNHLQQKYGLQMSLEFGMGVLNLNTEIIDKFRRYLDSLPMLDIVCLECIASRAKSTGIALSLLDDFLTLEEAIKAARLEEELQQDLYGKVEGAHDVDEEELKIYLAACKIIYSLNKLETPENNSQT